MTGLALVLGAGLAVQALDLPLLRIVSPAPDAPAVGLVPVRAEVHPSIAGRVARVAFRVDGQPLCTRDAPPYECDWDAGPAAGVHVIRAAAELSGGDRAVASLRTGALTPTPATPGRLLTLPADVNVVQVPATVTDDEGRFVPGLPAEAFRVFEDDARQPVTHLLGQGTPREVVVAVDMSGSMAEAMPQVRRAVRSFLAALKPEDQVTLLAFNDAVFTLARRETAVAARLRAVDRLAPWGGTALFDAVVRSFDLLAARRGRKVLVVFTDGEDQSSRAALDDVRKRAETNDAPVYLVGQGRGTSERRLKDVLDRLAAMSGGRAFHTDDARELERVFALIVEELEHQYLLGYEPTAAADDGSWRRIRVETVGPRHHVRARQGYRALPRAKEGDE